MALNIPRHPELNTILNTRRAFKILTQPLSLNLLTAVFHKTARISFWSYTHPKDNTVRESIYTSQQHTDENHKRTGSKRTGTHKVS